ncbi:MAG: hypothetical protein ACRC3K_02800, partial [Plesiomonas sp.]
MTKTFTTIGICVNPTLEQIFANNITINSAQLNTSITGVVSYGWRYRVVGTTEWTTLTSTAANFVAISGLSANTTYEFQVCVCCTTTNCSDWSISRTFTTPGTCTAPTVAQIFANSITTTSANLNTTVTGATSYDWQYRVLGSSTWIDVPATSGNSTTITGLSANTVYEFRVQVVCANGITSAWSDTEKFTTFGTCAAPTLSQLLVTNLTTNSATISVSIAGALEYGWRYRQQGAATWIDLPATAAASTALTGLTPNTTYEYQVRIKCTNGITSDWSPTGTFTTWVFCNTPTVEQISATNITINSAQLNTTITGVISYGWRYRVVGATEWINLPSSATG